MKKLIYGVTSLITACILLFTTIGSSAVYASENAEPISVESSEITQENVLYNNLIDLSGPRINLGTEVEPLVQPLVLPIIPLLATVTIRVAVPFLARTTQGVVVKISKHAAEQAMARNITGKMMDEALSTGLKHVDTGSGARVIWKTSSHKTAVLLEKYSDEVSTVYKQEAKKAKWERNNWSFKGDMD